MVTNTPSPTDTPSPTPSATITPTATASPSNTVSSVATATFLLGLEAVTSNAQWREMGGPIEQEFDGVMMVLVPAGCFDMGSTQEQRAYAESLGLAMQYTEDEIPVTEICFDAPFWIDKYEVTNEQYGSVGCSEYSSEPDQPRNCVTWYDARDYCESRGARLPTEREWEYAARGPDDLIYPWGNEFVAENVVYSDNSNRQTAEVGSRLGGVSWVGAYDLSGNVWEWVSSLYLSYDSTIDQENINDNSNSRVVRGGSFYGDDNLRAADRFRNYPTDVGSGIGFRCVRSY